MADRRTALRAVSKIEIFDSDRLRERVPLYVTGNISVGGMFLFTQEPFPKDTEFKISFTLPGAPQAIEARGKVVWKRESRQAADRQAGMGLRFIEIKDADRERIRAFVESQSEFEAVEGGG